MQKRAEDFNIHVGSLKKGKLNKITDVKGVTVGHCTVETQSNKTGVTVVNPQPNNIFRHKLPCAQFVINGYGKSVGLMQIEELGTLETPIAITNTLNVGLVQDAVIEHMISECQKDNIEITSINPVVCECNDSKINRIAKRVIGQKEVEKAFLDLSPDFMEGSVGAGRGTVCHGFKGGIGSASRIVELDGREYTLGVLVQSNYGGMKDLNVNGKNIGKAISEKISADMETEKGSIIMIVATDIPLSVRQLKRVIKRCSVGLARLGSFIGNGSGEVIIGFSTAYEIADRETRDFISINVLNENKIDLLFRACAESCEEATLNSMLTSPADKKINGEPVYSLADFIPLYLQI